MKTMLVGDTHCDAGFTTRVILFAAEWELDAVFVLGDFGYWPRFTDGPAFLQRVAKTCQAVGVPLYWLAGNHEDHDLLDSLCAGADGPFVPHDGVTHVRSGGTWEWDGYRIGALGGAVSIDRYARKAHVSWFEQEITNADLIPGMGQLDVLLTHDAPCPPVGLDGFYKRDPDSSANQRKIASAVAATGAQVLVHGHWHHFARWSFEGCTIQSLDCNHSGLHAATAILDTGAGQLQTLDEFLHHEPGVPLHRAADAAA